MTTNRDFLVGALRRPEFVEGRATTAFVADAPPPTSRPTGSAVALASLLLVERGGPSAPSPGWRASPVRLLVDGAEWGTSVRRQGGDWIVTVDGEAVTMRLVSRDEAEIRDLARRRCRARVLWTRRRRPLARFRRRLPSLRRSDLRPAAARGRACGRRRALAGQRRRGRGRCQGRAIGCGAGRRWRRSRR